MTGRVGTGAGTHAWTLPGGWRPQGNPKLQLANCREPSTDSPLAAARPCSHCQIHLQEPDRASTASMRGKSSWASGREAKRTTVKCAVSQKARSQEEPGNQASPLRSYHQSLTDLSRETASPSQLQLSSPAYRGSESWDSSEVHILRCRVTRRQSLLAGPASGACSPHF